jgi:hypothetical protein
LTILGGFALAFSATSAARAAFDFAAPESANFFF